MKWFFTCCCVIVFSRNNGLAQISPPGEGIAHTAEWFAVGVRQRMNMLGSDNWQSMSYIGWGRKSNPDNYDPLYKPAIFVLNQEFYHQVNPRVQYSLALSYRRQDEYLERPPFEHKSPGRNQEFRMYGRLSHIFKTSRIKFIPTFRQEFRTFYTPDFKEPEEHFQFRSRFRVQLTVNLDKEGVHRLVAGSEQLFSMSKESGHHTWTGWEYRESRFSLYYSLLPDSLPFIFSIGYMNNWVAGKASYDAHYLAMDIVIENPFGR